MDESLRDSGSINDEMKALQLQMEQLQMKKDKSISICLVCQDKVMLPVKLVTKDNTYCPFSEKNPICLLCIRTWMARYRKNQLIDCLGRCCRIRINGFRTYGEIGRDPADIPEKEWWTKLGSVGMSFENPINSTSNLSNVPS